MQDEIDVSELAGSSSGHTEQLEVQRAPALQRFRLQALEGAKGGQVWESTGSRMTLGSHPSNDVVLDDPAVSRFHCELKVTPRGVWLEDLGSSNGTTLDGVAIGKALLRVGSVVRLGRAVLQFQPVDHAVILPLSTRTEFGDLVGNSWAMRQAFALLERAAASDATVLIEGETGTGKEGAAEAIHTHSLRGTEPFIVVDCSALPANLLESELFGHERGAFTGATERRIGAFEAAHKGTLFLDEIGELPLDLQPKLLRVLEKREIRRVGSNQHQLVDVRVVAATNRDLRSLVNAGTFRSDIYYRLAVLHVALPALRERPEDFSALITSLGTRLGVSKTLIDELTTAESLARLQRGAWPGNVRELRNFVERCGVMQQTLPLAGPDASSALEVDTKLSFAEAKQRLVDQFERRYLSALLQQTGGNVSQAARHADLDRPYLYKLLYRHGVRVKE
ncbi:MAG TPA: sigma 54-interacting transcriptional regulator [Polyangiaceae bacterium]|nr:sigma 54-interacting transcriptional regulator [Polyangiaceae bacterium]